MSDKIVQLSDASFEADVIKADSPVLSISQAEWCGPCKMIAPDPERGCSGIRRSRDRGEIEHRS